MEQQIGMVGLGRMGGNMARRIARAGLGVVAWDAAAGARAGIGGEERVLAVPSRWRRWWRRCRRRASSG